MKFLIYTNHLILLYNRNKINKIINNNNNNNNNNNINNNNNNKYKNNNKFCTNKIKCSEPNNNNLR